MTTHTEMLSMEQSSNSSPSPDKQNKKQRLVRTCCKVFPTFHPYGPVRIIWDGFILLALIYTAIEIPLTLAFEVDLSLSNTLGIMAFSIDMLLLLDICLNFRTQYFDKYDRLLLHTDEIEIAKRYFKSWFWLDLLTSFPIEFIVHDDIGSYLKVLRVFRLIRIFKILRVIRIMKMFDGLSKMIYVAREMFFMLRLFKIVSAMILTAHCFACIWWHVGCTGYKEDIPPFTNDDDVTKYSSWIQAQGIDIDDSLTVKYSASWYWAVVTLFTTGYGDITAHNPTEQWVCSICILTGSCLFAYFIGILTTWVAEGDRVRSFELQKVEEAQAFCRHHKFDRTLTRTILTHVRYYCNYNFVFEAEDILPILPPFLQRDVNAKIASKYLSKMDLFKDLPQEVIGQIALTMHSISCNGHSESCKGYLYRRGDVAKCMYLQRTGLAKLKYFDGTFRELCRGDVMGERSLIAGTRRYEVICLTWSEFYVLNIECIKTIFRNSFKPKRFKYEWNTIKKKVKMSEIRHCKTQRRCQLTAKNPSVDVSRQVVHDLSRQASSLRSDLLEKFMFSPKKDGDGYEKVVQDDNLSDEGASERPYMQSCVLDMDDVISSNKLFDISRVVSSYTSEFVESKSCLAPKTSSSVSVPTRARSKSTFVEQKNSGSTSGSDSFFLKMPMWRLRNNSERRNEKVKLHNAGKKASRPTSPPNLLHDKSFKFEHDHELDMDDSTDDSDILAVLTPNPRLRSVPSARGSRGMSKFGQTKKRNMTKGKRRRKGIGVTRETLESVKNDFSYDNDNSVRVGSKNGLPLKQKLQKPTQLELSKVTEYDINGKSYEATHSGSSSSTIATDQEIIDENVSFLKGQNKNNDEESVCSV